MLEKVPFIALAVLFTILTIQIQSDTAVKDLEEISFINRIFAAGYGFNTYVLKFLIPYKLHTFYPYPPLSNPPSYFYIMPFFSLGIVGLWYWLFWKNKRVLFGLLFFLLTISITLQLFSFGGAILSERYTYIPYIGLAICMGLLIDYLIKRDARQRNLIFGGAIIYGLFLSITTFQQTKVWKDGITLWSKVIDNMAFSAAIPYSNRGFQLKEQGRTQEALRDFDEALQRNTKEEASLLGKANILFNQGNYQEALQWYNQLIAINPNHVEGLSSRGACLAATQRWDEALVDLNKAISLDARFMDAVRNKGVVLMNTKRFEEAIDAFQEYLKYKPNDTMMLNTIGVCHQNLNQHQEALSYFNSCLRLEPQNGMWYNNRGISYRALGQAQQAKTDFIQAQNLGFNVNPMFLNE